jgi:hypothetical protein
MPNKKKICPGDPSLWKYCNYCCNFKSVDEFTIKICRPCQAKKNATNAKYAHGKTGKVTRANFWKSAPGKTVRKKYNASEGGKKARDKWANSDKGAAYKTVFNKRQSQNYHEKPGHMLNLKLSSAFKSIVKGEQESSVFLDYTEFESGDDVLAHFARQLPALGDGVKMSDHGPVWWIGHRIPRVYFDHTNMEDVKRCWSKVNMFPQLKEDNQKDESSLTKETCTIVGEAHFPLSWGGTTPSDSKMSELYFKVRAGEM